MSVHLKAGAAPLESEVVMAVAEVVAENRRLRRQIDVLNAKLIEVSANGGERQQLIRNAYRRGYHTGHSAGRRGAVAVTNPEASARGWVRAELADQAQ
ncbi:MAG: hypothetical protein JHD16_00245 [Solirubrobacteraceae bacterium]|nr:hypothetical protein [Solirubrobacteraceae bacterium]